MKTMKLLITTDGLAWLPESRIRIVYYLELVTLRTPDLFLSALFTLISDTRRDVERVLRRAEIINGINSLSYEERLQELKMHCLDKHQLSKDMIIVSKYLKGENNMLPFICKFKTTGPAVTLVLKVFFLTGKNTFKRF